MELEQFVKARTEPKNSKYRTVNLDEDLHLFLKRTANHYNIALADLTYNILAHWKRQYQSDINRDIVNQFRD